MALTCKEVSERLWNCVNWRVWKWEYLPKVVSFEKLYRLYCTAVYKRYRVTAHHLTAHAPTFQTVQINCCGVYWKVGKPCREVIFMRCYRNIVYVSCCRVFQKQIAKANAILRPVWKGATQITPLGSSCSLEVLSVKIRWCQIGPLVNPSYV